MTIQGKYLRRLVISLVLVLLASLTLSTLAQASPPAQDPRPPVDDSSNGGGSSGTGGDGNGSPELRCAKLSGQVTNWGFGPQADIGTELKTGSWKATSISASDGTFGYGGLGVGLATLHVAIAPGDAKRLKPLIQDAGIYLSCDYPIVANIAVYSGDEVDPPATITMSASSQTITPGDDFSFTLTVKNGLPNEITNVIVTNMMPRGLKALQVSSSLRPKDAQIVDGGSDGQLVVVNLDKLAKGAKATITIKVNADVDLLGGTKIKNTATLFYPESFAHQASVDLTVSNGEEPIQASAGSTSEAGADFVPPANAPTTGGDLLTEEETSTSPDKVIPASSTAKPGQESAGEFIAPGNMPSTGGDLLSTLEIEEPAEIVVNQSQATTDLPSEETSTIHLSNVQANREAGEVRVVVDEAVSKGSPITVVTGFLFLGLLTLGSGVAILTRRTTVWSQGKE